MINNNVDILCLQEVEIEKDYDFHSLNLKNYGLDVENNAIKSRVGIIVSNNYTYKVHYKKLFLNCNSLLPVV